MIQRIALVLAVVAATLSQGACTEINNITNPAPISESELKVVIPPFPLQDNSIQPGSGWVQQVTFYTPSNWDGNLLVESSEPNLVAVYYQMQMISQVQPTDGVVAYVLWVTSIALEGSAGGESLITVTPRSNPNGKSSFRVRSSFKG